MKGTPVIRVWGTVVAAGLLLGLAAGRSPAGPRVKITPETWPAALAEARDARGRFKTARILEFGPGHYHLDPVALVDSTCGNCEDPAREVAATVGLVVSGSHIQLVGKGDRPEEVVLHTRAGYGILFEDCQECRISGLTVTDGVRDPDPNATCAGIVVRRSKVTIEDCLVRDNLGDAAVVKETVVGVMGVAGREGADLLIRNNHLLRNSWDGIALYRGARARIEDNVIDGVDKAAGANLGGGRGVGIGVTWDAVAEIELNLVTRYWKGIGIFVDAEAVVRHNVIEEILTWGIVLWDAGRGRPVGRIEGNLVHDTGACGIAITREAPGEPAAGFCRGNVILRTGQNPKYDDPEFYCYQCPVAVHACPDDFEIAGNLLLDNRRAGPGASPPDLAAPAFRTAAMPLLRLLLAQPALMGARCFRELDVPGTSSIYR